MIPFIARCRVPKTLESVRSRSEREVEPRSAGLARAAVEGIWEAVERLYRSGMHPAIQLSLRRRGQVVLDRAIGHAAGNGPNDPPDARRVFVTPDTPFCIFSASKAVSAMVIHLLDQQHRLHVDDPVTEYIPEFGRHGKDRITIEHVLTHRAGVPNLPPEHLKLEYLSHPETIVRLLCEAKPTWAPGRRLAYHAVTGGFVLAEIVRRVTGKTIRAVLRDEILAPLGFRWMNFGVKPGDVKKVARSYFTGPPPLPPLSHLIKRALGVDFRQAAEISNEPRFLTGIIPSANVVTSANELGRFYQLLLNGGELDGVRIFEPRTIHRATSEQSYLEFDLTLGIPLRYSMGFMLGGLGLYGPDTPHAFGHVGFINIFAWADPERQVAAALTTSGKPLLYPEIYYIYDIMRQISASCPKEAAPRAAATRGRPGRRAARARTATTTASTRRGRGRARAAAGTAAPPPSPA
jgi:CubicO group peptidase (beta-lactamase class C family)